MTLISGPINTITSTPSAVTHALITINKPRTQGAGLIAMEEKTIPITNANFNQKIAPGPAVIRLVIAGMPGSAIPILVDDVASQSLADVVEAARLAEGHDAQNLAAFVQQVLAARADVLDAKEEYVDVFIPSLINTWTGITQELDEFEDDATAIIDGARDFALGEINTAKTGALDTIEGEVAKAENAADRAESAVNTGVGDGAVTLQKLAPDVVGEIDSKADLIGGKVPTSQIPEVALTKPFQVTSRAELLALVAQEGDIGIITAGEDKGTYILGAGPVNDFDSWVPMAVSADSPVTSVNGQVGTVVLGPADVGAAPTTHQHTTEQIQDFPDVKKISSGVSSGFFAMLMAQIQQLEQRINDQPPALKFVTETVTGTNGDTTFSRLGDIVFVKADGNFVGATIPETYRPTVNRRVATADAAGSTPRVTTIRTDGTGDWTANTTFNYPI